MRKEEISKAVSDTLEAHGCKVRIVSLMHISDLRNDIEAAYLRGLFDEGFYQKELVHFEFTQPASFPDAKSLIVVAAPQSHVRVIFNLNGKSFPCIIPSNYSHKTDERVKDILESALKPIKNRLVKAKLPLKALAVHSGLARYGRNNITYVEGMGSYHRLVAFYSPLSADEDQWEELKFMEQCETCVACQKICPTDAIPLDRFLLRAERCLSFFNEHLEEFPSWVDPSWHNCLVGCLLCQKVCPVDRECEIRTVDGPSFSAEETQLLLKGIPEKKLPKKTLEKLEELDMKEYSSILGRNLRALFSGKNLHE